MIKVINRKLICDLLDRAEVSERKRMNLNWHPEFSDPVQRLFNALQPETYVRPHRHVSPPRWELFLILTGCVVLLTFDDDGLVTGRHELRAVSDVTGIEVAEKQWHAIVAMEPSVLFEIKEGPYTPVTDKDFASWAPEEGRVSCVDVVEWYRVAQVGEKYGA